MKRTSAILLIIMLAVFVAQGCSFLSSPDEGLKNHEAAKQKGADAMDPDK